MPDALERAVRTMARTLVHRGPDAEGTWSDPGAGVALGHRRLAVVELSEAGGQPMRSADGRYVLAYNGEVYNHGSLRSQLAGSGVSFRGSSDTEVLLAAVARWGLERALDACEGMFAFALYDRRERSLHLVRDRFGEKPLYYGWLGQRLAFASELKALRALPGSSFSLDRDALARFFRHNCIPAPASVYEGVRKLSPGHLVTFGPETPPGFLPEPRCYWSAAEAVEAARARPLAGSAADLVDRLEDVLTASVAARAVADVPVGAFLSGGIDSSLVVALMQRTTTHPVRTFTIGFADRAFDESGEAAAVAAHLGTDHTCVEVTDDEAAATVARLPSVWDEPFADASQIPTLLVSAVARRDVTVSLSGDGGDELFAGYNRHAWLARLWSRAGRVPAPARAAVAAGMERLPPGPIDAAFALAGALHPRLRVRTPSTKVAKVAKVLAASAPEDAYLALTSHWADPLGLVRGARSGGSLAERPDTWPDLGGITEQMLWLDLVGYLPDDILAKVDRAAMAASLETRVPFLDRSVLDLAWRLPLDLKLRDGQTKWVLRQVLHRHVPPALVERPKMGFGLPIGAWLRTRLRPWAEELLDERRLLSQGIVDPGPVRRAWALHLSGRRDFGYELWDVLMLEAWLDEWAPSEGR
jgi:asparagine synthase (glutamine-hydrolysing)